MWRPCSVGAIEPVGMTKASASKVRNKNASAKAITIDSTVSRMVRAMVGLFWALLAVLSAVFSAGAGRDGLSIIAKSLAGIWLLRLSAGSGPMVFA